MSTWTRHKQLTSVRLRFFLRSAIAGGAQVLLDSSEVRGQKQFSLELNWCPNENEGERKSANGGDGDVGWLKWIDVSSNH